jgi:hypothetical protein
MTKKSKPTGGSGQKKPASQQRGKKSGPDLSKAEMASKEEVEQLLDEYADDIQNSEE